MKISFAKLQKSLKKRLFWVICFIACAGVGYFYIHPYIFPALPDLQQPTGAYAVGMSRYEWQANMLVASNTSYKIYAVDIFYPSSTIKSSQRYPYQPEKMVAFENYLTRTTYIPRCIWQRLLRGVHTYTQPNAPIYGEGYKDPVILYLPGIGSEDLHNLYTEQLASHGYVVVAIEPPHDVLLSVRANGSAVELDPTLAQAIQQNDRDVIYLYRNQAHERWVQYILSVIDHLRMLNNDTNSPFYQALELENIGPLGHSHGGAVALDFCQKNKLCKVGVNMDGWTKTYNRSDYFETPFLMLLSESGAMPEMQEFFKNNQRNAFTRLVVSGAGHGAFSDGVLVKGIARLLLGGGDVQGGYQLYREISEQLVQFFDRHMK